VGKIKNLHVVSIDPGDKHVGMCVWLGGQIEEAKTIEPLKMAEIIEVIKFDMVVIEDFKLYPWLAQKQGFSAMKTPQLIGALKYLAHRNGSPVAMQPATIKRHAFERMDAQGFDMPKGGQHMRDAVAHGWWWHFKNPDDTGLETPA